MSMQGGVEVVIGGVKEGRATTKREEHHHMSSVSLPKLATPGATLGKSPTGMGSGTVPQWSVKQAAKSETTTETMTGRSGAVAAAIAEMSRGTISATAAKYEPGRSRAQGQFPKPAVTTTSSTIASSPATPVAITTTTTAGVTKFIPESNQASGGAAAAKFGLSSTKPSLGGSVTLTSGAKSTPGFGPVKAGVDGPRSPEKFAVKSLSSAPVVATSPTTATPKKFGSGETKATEGGMKPAFSPAKPPISPTRFGTPTSTQTVTSTWKHSSTPEISKQDGPNNAVKSWSNAIPSWAQKKSQDEKLKSSDASNGEDKPEEREKSGIQVRKPVTYGNRIQNDFSGPTFPPKEKPGGPFQKNESTSFDKKLPTSSTDLDAINASSSSSSSATGATDSSGPMPRRKGSLFGLKTPSFSKSVTVQEFKTPASSSSATTTSSQGSREKSFTSGASSESSGTLRRRHSTMFTTARGLITGKTSNGINGAQGEQDSVVDSPGTNTDELQRLQHLNLERPRVRPKTRRMPSPMHFPVSRDAEGVPRLKE